MDEKHILLELDNILLNPPPKHNYFLYGKEYKAAKRFPAHIESFAEEIENVNTGSLFYELLLARRKNAKAGSKEPWVLANDYRRALEVYRELPTTLRAYAKFVGFAIREKKRRPCDRVHFVIALIDQVKRATGTPHYKEIEALLDAVFQEQGETSPYHRKKLGDLWRKTRHRLLPLLLSPNDLE